MRNPRRINLGQVLVRVLGGRIHRTPLGYYAITLPVLWSALDYLNFHYPGDEYAFWAICSMPAFWLNFIWDFSNGRSPDEFLPVVLAAGAATMALGGLLLDLTRPKWGIWILLWAVLTAFLCNIALDRFETLERAVAKNGSVQAYVVGAMNLGLIGASAMTLFPFGAYRLGGVAWRRFRSTG